jgi:hypothetical protein
MCIGCWTVAERASQAASYEVAVYWYSIQGFDVWHRYCHSAHFIMNSSWPDWWRQKLYWYGTWPPTAPSLRCECHLPWKCCHMHWSLFTLCALQLPLQPDVTSVQNPWYAAICFIHSAWRPCNPVHYLMRLSWPISWLGMSSRVCCMLTTQLPHNTLPTWLLGHHHVKMIHLSTSVVKKTSRL